MKRVKFFNALLKFRVLVIFSSMVITGVALSSLVKLEADNSVEIWFDESDQILLNYEKFKENFGNDFGIIMFYYSDGLFSKNELLLNSRLVKEISRLDNVFKVSGLSNFETISFYNMKLVKHPLIPASGVVSKKRRQKLEKDPVLINTVISKNADVTAIHIEPEKTDSASNIKLLDDVTKLLSGEEFFGHKYRLTGYLTFLVELNRLSDYEAGMFVTVNIFIIFILLWIILRSARLSIIALLIAATGAIWAMGAYSVENSINMVSAIIPLIILVVSVAGSVHIIIHYKNKYIKIINNKQKIEPKEALAGVLGDLLTPCFFTSLTTAVAFLAFQSSSIPPLRSLGLYTAIGVSFSFLLTFTLLPSLLSYVKFKETRTNFSKAGLLQNIIDSLPVWVQKRRVWILLFSVVAILSAFEGIRRIEFETDQMKYLKPSHPTRMTSDELQKQFDGILPVEINLTASKKGYFYNRVNFAKIREMAQLIEEIPDVKVVISPVTFMDEYIQAIQRRVPVRLSPAMINEGIKEVMKIKPDSFAGFISGEYDARITARLKWVSQDQMIRVIETIDEKLRPLWQEEEIKAFYTGNMVVYSELNDRLLQSQIYSIGFSFGIIFFMMLLLTRSFRLGLLAMVPNIVPVVITLGVIGLSGTKLDVGTVLIAAISLGLAVDDTIHFVYAYMRKRKTGLDLKSVIMRSVHYAGVPIFITSVVLVGGFSVMMLSDFLPVTRFGMFVSLNVFLALVCDLVLLPALLLTGRQK